MTKETSTKENKLAAFKTFMNALRPIRDWLKTTPPIVEHPHLIQATQHQPLPPPLPPSAPPPRQHYQSQQQLFPSHIHQHDLDHHLQLQQQHQQRQHQQEQQLYQHQLHGFQETPTVDSFKRSTKARMSLPIMQANRLQRQAYSQLQKRGGHHPAQSLGHIYLQHQGETKQANLPNELTAIDTIRALFVCAFPNMLTMEYMSQAHVKIYIYNPSCNIFYELRDIDDVRHESVLRIHQSDPILALPLQQLQQHYPTMQRLGPPQIPPPKPRRMIPMNGTLRTSPNSSIYGAAPMQFQQLPYTHSQASPQLQPIYSQTSPQMSSTPAQLSMSRHSMIMPSPHQHQIYQQYQQPNNQLHQQQQQQQTHQLSPYT